MPAGDFFESVSEGDVYVIKKVIHDWNDERAIAILRNCRRAMRPNGKVLVAETLVPPGDEPDQIKGIDVIMLAVTGGRSGRRNNIQLSSRPQGYVSSA